MTLRRTAAATALAARHLARPDSSTLAICGCGAQAGAQLDALRQILSLDTIVCWDLDPAAAAAFAAANGGRAVPRARDAAEAADVIVACTPATEPFLTADMVGPGTFIAAVGADAPHKSEIDPELMAKALVVADSIDQCTVMGDLHHAIEAGAITAADVHAELADLVAGTKPGRTDDIQITLFNSTGTAVQDVASAVRIYCHALATESGLMIMLGR